MRRASIVICVTLVGLAACSRRDYSNSNNTGGSESTAVGEATITSAESPTATMTFLEEDPRLTHRIEAAIAADPVISAAARNVGVTVEHGVVQLTGSVADKDYRREIDRIVKRVPGVQDTRNEIDVSLVRDRANRESDDTISFALQRSLASLPSVGDDSERVTIDVLNGRVVLRGKTRFVTTRDRIEGVAKQTPGVIDVVDEIVVD